MEDKNKKNDEIVVNFKLDKKKLLYIFGGIGVVLIIVVGVLLGVNGGDKVKIVKSEVQEITLENYEKAYSSKKGNVVIGLMTYDMSYDITARDYTEFYKSSLSSAYSCGNVQTSPINYYNWEKLECGGGRENIKNYIAIQNNRLYLLAVSYQDESLLEAKEIMNHIEKNLRFSNTVA